MTRKNRKFGRLAAVAALALLAISALGSAQALDRFAGANRNYDARIEARRIPVRRFIAQQETALDSLRAQIPGLKASISETGAVRSLTSTSGYLTAPGRTDALTTATSFLEANTFALGLKSQDIANYEVRDVVPSKVTGATRVYLQQVSAGLEVYNGVYQANVNRDGRIMAVHNGFMPSIAISLNAIAPLIRPEEAVASAARHLGIRTLAPPVSLGSLDGSVAHVTSVDPSGLSLEPITARLMILPIQEGQARLVWNFQIRTLDRQHWFDMTVDAVHGKVWTRIDWVASDQYRVYPQPAESPNHVSPTPPADGRTLVVNPANSIASPFGWHDTNGSNGAEFTIMRGNNVHAYDDANANNSPPASQPDCGGSLNCDFLVNLNQAPSTYRPAAIANLFYWNNIIHDVTYQYGFDEISGNFQFNNYGNGGSGSDEVLAEAQDGVDTNNANFGTPPDGSNPRMQMFLWTAPNPDIDGDFDDGIVVHEYGHGISNRLVGGPSNASCLGNSQQPGEGWSDWYALALTAEVGDQGTDGRGIGTYALNQPTSGLGIRTQRYSTNPAINNFTYQAIRSLAVPHGVGSVWAQALWEVYWTLVDQHGFDPDLYNAAGGSGNQRALLYVTEGLKNTACSPTFLDTRDGVIQAVVDNFGGVDECRVWQAFADFGLGVDATTTGSNGSATNGFEVPVQCQCSPQPLADAGPDKQVCLGSSATIGTPALPDTTYSWSPGGLTSAQISVAPPTTTIYNVTATTACGSANDSVTVLVDDGTNVGLDENFENGLAGWTAAGLWHLTTNSSCASPGYSSPFNALYYGQDASCDYTTGGSNSGNLVSPTINGVSATSTLTFDYFRQVESFAGDFDWTRVDVSGDGGATWTNVWSRNARNASENAWTSSGAISLAAFAGQAIQVRFNFDTVDNVANNFTGWFIDDVVVTGESQCGGNQPPITSIEAPTNGSTFDEGVTIDFTGSANDPEDGDVSDSLSWSSSIDGAFGTGASVSAVLSIGTHTITATATDSQTTPGTDSITVTVNNVNPTVSITSPADGAIFNEGDSVIFDGTANDPVEGNLSASISWSSSIDGDLGTGSSVSGVLSVGSHTITASATDSNSGTGTDTITVVVNNTPPAVTITSPADGSSFDEGTSIGFTGTASDAGDGDLSSSIQWSSSISGIFGNGASVSASLPVGTHTITASATDSNTATGTAVITVTVTNVAPSVNITAPPGGTSVAEGAPINFVGTASDPGDGDLSGEISWSSSLDGALGTGASISATLSVGAHTVTASATDSNGASGSDSITVTVNSNGSPSVTISSPGDGSSFDEGASISFAGSATDPEDGNVSASLTWSSSLDGAIGSGASFSTVLSVGTHTITATATDSGGADGSASISVTVTANTSPSVNITAPADGSSFDEGVSVTFSGVATDAQDGTLSASLSWTSSLDNAIGSGATFSTSGLSAGSHTITASVTDSGGLTGSASISLTINSVGGGDFIDWNATPLVAYSNQDAAGTVAIEDAGATVFMQGNRWRRTQTTFAVTANTVIEFEFQSTSEGEIHGIGFDENNTLTDQTRIFELHGTQNWGGAFHNFDNQYSPVGSFQTYNIPVGDFYTGSAMFLVLVNDKDAGAGTNTSRFRNVRVFEDVPPPPPPGCTVIDFESGTSEGWTNNATSTCSTGTLVVGTPTQVINSGVVTQVGGDHTTGSGNAFFTATNSSAGVNDVDGGTCVAESGTISVAENSDVSLWYFHGQRDAGDDANDFFSLEISTNSGSSWTSMAGFGDVTVNAAWTEATTTVSAGANVRFRLQVADASGPGDLVEAGVDDILICPASP